MSDVVWSHAGMKRIHIPTGKIFSLSPTRDGGVCLQHRLTGSSWIVIEHYGMQWRWQFMYGYNSDPWVNAESEGDAMHAALKAAGVVPAT